MVKSNDKKLHDCGEFALIQRLQKTVIKNHNVKLGIGDDAAVIDLPKGSRLIATSDLLVEGVHFDLATTTAKQLGHKALAVNLSDIAAMGGKPLAALVSLAMPKNTPLSFVDGFFMGFKKLAQQFKTELAGGDITASLGGITINVTLLGHVKKTCEIKRSNAKPGDSLYLLGDLGLARAGLEALQAGSSVSNKLKQAQLSPMPLIKEGLRLAKSKHVNSLIDISDGLLADMQHVALASSVCVEIFCDKLPIKPELASYVKQNKLDAFDYLLAGGEDYSLCFTLSKNAKRPLKFAADLSQPIKIGQVVKGSGVRLLDGNRAEIKKHPKGFLHF